MQSIGARFAHGELTLEEAAELGCRACGTPGRRLPVPRHRGHFAGRRRGARAVAAAFGAGPVGPADLARHGGAVPRALVESAGARHQQSRHSHRRRHSQCHGRARGLRRLDESAAAHPGHRASPPACAGRRSRIGSTSTARCRAWSTCLPNGPVGHPTVQRLPGRRRARSDAAPTRAGPARLDVPHGDRRAAGRRARLVGASERRNDCANRCRSTTASIPTT